jgi:multidrug efflux system membrane fusion protein
MKTFWIGMASISGLLVAGCEQAPVELQEVVRPVRYTEVVPAGGSETRIFSGVTKAALETDLSFKVGGLVTKLDAVVGDRVARGQVIAQLEPTDFEVTLREAQAGLERAKAEERNAEAAFERTRELYENRNASRSDLDTARAMAESAGALVRATAQQLEGVRLQLSYTQLTSPQECTIARRHVEINQNVSPGQPVVRVNCGDCAEIRVDVPGLYIGRIENDARVKVNIAALPGRELTGVVTEVGVGTDQNRSIYPVTVVLQDGCDAVRSGMAADVNMRLAGQSGDESFLVVPLVSVGEDRDGNFVFVLEPQDAGRYVARRRDVAIGRPGGEGIELIAGVEEGELIATAGVRRLVDGQVVTLLGASGS